MTTYVAPAVPFITSATTDAQFRAWGKNISDGLKAVGMVQTADTGQVDWSTAITPGNNASVQAAYEIYRFNDALQATKPVFMKISYGTGPFSATKPALYIQMGTGSNGAGALTAPVSAQVTLPLSSGASTAAFPSYFFGDGSGFSALIGDSGAYCHWFFNVERTRNPSDGSPVGEGVLAYCYMPLNYSNYGNHNWCMFPTNGRTNPGGWHSGFQAPTLITPHPVTTGVVGTDVYLWPQFGAYPSLYPHLNLYTYAAQDITRLTEFQMNALGAVHTYKAFDLTSAVNGNPSLMGAGPVPGVAGATPRSAYAMRWE